MFDLERSITEWRRRLQAAGMENTLVLDELESHLREDFRSFLSAGETEPRAFELAVRGLGNPRSVQTEFNKINRGQIWPVKIGSWLWIGAVALVATLLARGLFAGKLNLLTYAHIVSVTAGYGAAFLMGGLGICHVCWRRSQKLSPVRQRSLGHAVYWFSHLAVGLVIVGTALGMPVSKQYFGRYWRWDPKEIGALCVAVWLMALAARQRFRQISDRITMLMCIGGNIVVSLAWFGAGIIDHKERMHSYGAANYWPLAAFLGINLCCLMVDMVPRQRSPEP